MISERDFRTMILFNSVHILITPCPQMAVLGLTTDLHKFERDERLPLWHGWHAARRGLGTNLYRLGVPDKVIQTIQYALTAPDLYFAYRSLFFFLLSAGRTK